MDEFWIWVEVLTPDILILTSALVMAVIMIWYQIPHRCHYCERRKTTAQNESGFWQCEDCFKEENQ